MPNAAVKILREVQAIAAVTTPITTVSYIGWLAANSPAIVRSGRLYHADCHMHARVPVNYMSTKLVIDCDKIDRLADEEGSFAFLVIREMYARNVYLWCFQLDRMHFDNVIDAGGNRGLFTTFASKLAKQVVYIEPLVSYRKCLAQLLADNPSSCQVHIENASFWVKLVRKT